MASEPGCGVESADGTELAGAGCDGADVEAGTGVGAGAVVGEGLGVGVEPEPCCDATGGAGGVA
jgi:hypothetical protein